MANKRWDIFCKIVDNYGDIGVCWRLSRQLAQVHGLAIRLFIDDFKVAAMLITGLQENTFSQHIEGVEIVPWLYAEALQPAAVALETFGCGLPALYLQKMAPLHTSWINVEYLSAEPWVNDFHAKPSQQANLKLIKYYFFPGFTEQSGGLIREQDLVIRRNDFLKDAQVQHKFWHTLGVNLTAGLNISLFGYPQANVNDFLAAIVQGSTPVNVLVPTSSILETIKPLYPAHDFCVGSVLRIGKLTLYVLPFLSQDDYDLLLWACDVNFVRGEDSWVRAIWAGKPLIWQPYIQSENTHLIKLDAYLQHYLLDAPPALKACMQNAHYAWSAVEGLVPAHIWAAFFNTLPQLKQYAKMRAQAFAAQADLASKLVIFSEKIQQNQV